MGVPGKRVSDGGMCGFSRLLLSGSNWRSDMLGIVIPPIYYSTLLHQVLRLRVGKWRKYTSDIL